MANCTGENGLAIIYSNGSEFWYLNNKLHRVGGPACIWVSGREEWWIEGKRKYYDQINAWLSG